MSSAPYCTHRTGNRVGEGCYRKTRRPSGLCYQHDATLRTAQVNLASLERAALDAACARRKHEHTWDDSMAASPDGEHFEKYHVARESLSVVEDAAVDALLAARAELER